MCEGYLSCSSLVTIYLLLESLPPPLFFPLPCSLPTICYLPGTWSLENSRRSLRSHSDMKAAWVYLRRMHCGMFPPTLYRSLVINLLREHSTTHSCWEQRILSLSIPQCWIQKKYCLWGALESSFSGLSLFSPSSFSTLWRENLQIGLPDSTVPGTQPSQQWLWEIFQGVSSDVLPHTHGLYSSFLSLFLPCLSSPQVYG